MIPNGAGLMYSPPAHPTAPALAVVNQVPHTGYPHAAPGVQSLAATHAQLLDQHAQYDLRIKALENGGNKPSSGAPWATVNTRSGVFKKARSFGPIHGPPTEDEKEKIGDWVPINRNAYGAFIHQAFHEEVIGMKGALVQYGPMVVVSFLCQTCIVYELWRELPKTRNPDLICNIHSNLQLAAIGVFLLVMFENIPKMYNHFSITLICKRFRQKGTTEVQKPDHTLRIKRRTTMFILAVFSEFVAWFAILSVGIIWLLSASSHENLIRTTVAITFVNNVDEFVYNGCVTESRQAEHGGFEYHVGISSDVGSPGLRHPLKRYVDTMFDTYYTHFHLITITGIACGLVYGVRVSQVNCDPF